MQLENKVLPNLIMIPKNKAVFLDRDGILNKDRSDYVKNIRELEIFPNIGKYIKQINDNGFLVIIITNQSTIGRKLTTHDEVKMIHNSIQEYMRKCNAKIDAFYYCPHHPKDNCNCRKPKPGLLIQASHDFNIDLQNSWMLGDHDSDVQSGLNVGCKSVKINLENSLEKTLHMIFSY